MRPEKDSHTTKKMIGLFAFVAILSAVLAQLFSKLAFAGFVLF